MGKPIFDSSHPEQLSWSTEITLDVEMVHAIASQADIALVIAGEGCFNCKKTDLTTY